MAMLPLMAVAQTDINKIWSRVESGPVSYTHLTLPTN